VSMAKARQIGLPARDRQANRRSDRRRAREFRQGVRRWSEVADEPRVVGIDLCARAPPAWVVHEKLDEVIEASALDQLIGKFGELAALRCSAALHIEIQRLIAEEAREQTMRIDSARSRERFADGFSEGGV